MPKKNGEPGKVSPYLGTLFFIIHPPLQPVFVLSYSRRKVFTLLQAVLGDNWQSTVINS
jgi:hypothetical protein